MAGRIAWRIGAVLLVGALAAGCGGGSGATVADSDASCTLSAVPTVTGRTTAYEVALSAATNEKGYFASKASVTVSGGLGEPTTTDEALETPIQVPPSPGIYVVQATIPLKPDAPSNYRGVSCQLTLTVNSGG
ncbi:hypothetical protein [Streptomyces sp. NPDC048111]|uniref:hypothetical protein n=1 Tax=Streptomyces sp. NPDC048111 TaxID=3365500 RepID=UPI003711B9B7